MASKRQSKTIQFQAVMAVIDVIIMAPQIFDPYMSAEAAASVVLILTAVHKGGSVYLRTITTTALTKRTG